MKINKQLKWFLPLFLMALLSPWSATLDQKISSFFFEHTSASFSKAAHHYYIYYWGVVPALATGIGSAVFFVLSFIIKKLEQPRFAFLFLSLSMAIGAGLITHVIFKEFWHRPRPVQTALFGGPQVFSPFYVPKLCYPNFCKSFPSGHAAMGFYFINLILLGYRLNARWLKQIGVAMTILMSSLLCYSRIAQGAHFLSDVLMSLVVTWYAALVVERIVFDYLAKNRTLSYTKD